MTNHETSRKHSLLIPSASMRAGFSVIEISIVVAIVGLMAVVAIPSTVRRMVDYRLDKAVTLLENDLRMARMHAISVCTRVQIDFDDADSSYRIWVDRDRDRMRDEREQETVTLPNVAGMKMLSSGHWGSFDPKGNFQSMGVSRGMHVDLHNAHARSKRITVFPSGEVNVYDYTTPTSLQ